MTPLWLLLVIPGVSAVLASSIAQMTDQRTEGWCSPAVAHTGGNVTIHCEGVNPKALQRLNELLDKKDLELQAKIREAEEWTRKYHQLSQALGREFPGNASAPEAKALLEEGKLEEAGRVLFTEVYNVAGHHRKHQNYDQAVAHYKHALQINPNHFGAYYNLANSYQKIGQSEEALRNFEKALNLSPNNARTHYNMANCTSKKAKIIKQRNTTKKLST